MKMLFARINMINQVIVKLGSSDLFERPGRWVARSSPVVLAFALMMPWMKSHSVDSLPIDGLVAQFEADAVELAGNSVLSWRDQSGSGNHLVAVGDPRIIRNALGDQPAIEFDGKTDRIERVSGLLGLPSGNSARTVYMLAKYQSRGFGGMSYGGASDNNAFGLIVDNVGRFAVQGWGAGNDFLSGIKATDGDWVVQSAVAFPGSLTHFVNGNPIGTATHQFNTSSERFVVGANLDASPQVKMLVGAILIYDRVLNVEERQQVENYLDIKYSINLANNRPPLARDDRKRLPSGATSKIDVLANDSDNGRLQTSSVTIATQPSFGSVSINSASGEITYTHSGNSTADSFTYTVVDDMGSRSNEGEVIITVGEPLQLPTSGLVAHYEADRLVNKKESKIESWGDQSGNGNTLTGRGGVTLVEDAINGQVAMDFNGRDAAFVRNDDLRGFSQGAEQRSVFMVVNYEGLGAGGFGYGSPSLNGAFGLHADSSGQLLINGYGLENDFTSEMRGSGAGWIIQSAIFTDDGLLTHLVNNKEINTAEHAFDTRLSTLVLGADLDQDPFVDMQVAALLVYREALNADDQSKVHRYLNDKYGVVSSGAPKTKFDTALVGFGQTININVMSNDVDDGILDPSTLTILKQPTNGVLVVDSSSGLMSYTQSGDATSDYFSYTIADDQGIVSSETTVKVNLDDDLSPIARDDVASLSSSGSVTVDVLRNDTDDFSISSSTVAIVAKPSNGSVSIEPFTGNVTYNHNGLSVSDEFTYTVSDSAGQLSNVGTVYIDITEPGVLVDDGLVLHLESSAGIVASGDQVTAWNDQSGFDNHLSARGNPILKQNVLNDLPVVDFDGMEDVLLREDKLASIPSGSSDRTVYFLARYRDVGYGGFAYGKPVENEVFGTVIDSVGHFTIQGWGDGNDFRTLRIADSEEWMLHSAILEGNEIRQYLNGELITSANHTFNTDSSNIMLGAEIDGSPAIDMQAAAVLVYDRALAEKEDLLVRNYLEVKYDFKTDKAPIANNDFLVLPKGTAGSIDVLANDKDDGDLDLTSIKILEQPSNGVAYVDASSGFINYLHNGDEYGDLFTYVVNDSLGQPSNVAVVTIANLPTGLVSHFEADSGVIMDSGLVTSWSDISGSGNDFTAKGNIELIANTLNGYPVLDFDGVNDVFVRVNELSNMPVGAADRSVYMLTNYKGVGPGGFAYGEASPNKAFGLQVSNSGELRVAGEGLANDFVSGVAGTDAGWMVQSALLSDGTLVHSANGEAIDTYEHDYNTVAKQMVLGAGFDLKTNISMQVAALMVFDRALSPAEEAEVYAYLNGKYNVLGVGSPETADDRAETTADGTIVIDVLNNDVAVEGTIDVSSVTIVRQPSSGRASVNIVNGLITYKHDGGSEVADSFSYTVENSQGRISSEATVLITIDDDLSPVANDDQFYIANAGSTSIAVLNNDQDDNSLDTTSVAIVAYPTGGVASVEQSTGLIDYTHDGSSIRDQFTYTVSDATGQVSNIATVEISIATPNILPTNGLVLHLASDSGISVTDNIVSAWIDQSNSGNDLISVGDPVLVPDVLNGHPVIDFDGNLDQLARSEAITNMPEADADRTVIMLSNYRGKGYGGFVYGAAIENNTFGAVVNSAGNLSAQGWGAGNDIDSEVVGSGEGWLIQSIVLQDDTVTQYKDGDEIHSESHVFDTIADRIVIGGALDGSYSVNMQVATVLVYDRAISAIEHLQVNNYLANKYEFAASNDAPPAVVPDSLVMPSGGSAVISVLANDSDDGQLLVNTVSIVRQPLNGVANINPITGAITYAHAGEISGDSFTYTVKDNLGQLSAEAEVTISNLPEGLVAHYESDKGVVLNRNAVVGWSDQSSSKNDLTATGEPSLVEAGLNGLPVVEFDGMDDLMKRELGVSSMPIGSADRSIYFVVNYKSVGSGGFGYGQQAFNKAFGLNVEENGYLRVNGFGSSNNFVSGTPGTGAGWIIQSVILDENTVMHSVNGQIIDQYLHAYETGVGPLVMGSDLDEDSSIKMQVASLLFFDRALTETEQDEVQSYLHSKYNVTGIGSPSVNDDFSYVISGGTIDIDVLANDEPLEGSIDSASIVIDRMPSNGMVSIDSSSGVVSYTHNGSSIASDSFAYTVANDSGRVSNAALVTVTIDDDLSPVTADDAVNVVTSGTIKIDVLANDKDDNVIVPGSVKLIKLPTGGSAVVDSVTGMIEYNHDGFSASDEFSYTVADDTQQTSDETTVRINVTTSGELITRNLVMHLESDAGVSVVDGVVTSWKDQVVPNNTLTAVGTPRLIPDALNESPAIDLKGGQLERVGNIDFLPMRNADRTVVMLAKYVGVGYGGFSYGEAADNRAFGAVVNAQGRLTVQGWGVENDFISELQGTDKGWLVQSIVVGSSSVTHLINNEEITAITHSFDTSANRMTLGAGLDGSPNVNMQVAAVLMYDRALSAIERLQVHDYLATKYDLAASNDAPPVATGDTALISKTGSVTVSVLENDLDDIGIDPATVTIVDQPLNGTVTVDAVTGVISYFHGSDSLRDSFTYTVADNRGQVSNTATVNVAKLPPGLVAHFESDFGVLKNKGGVSSWIDQSTQGNTLNASGDIQLIPNVVNGQPALDFDGKEDALIRSEQVTGLPLGSADRSIYLVVNYEGAGPGGFGYGQRATNKAFGLHVNKARLLGVTGYGDANNYDSTTLGAAANWLIQSAVLKDNTLVHSVNGNPVDTYLHNYGTSSGPLVVGIDIDQSNTVDMQIAAILIFDRALTEAEQNEIQAYLNDKYNVLSVGAPLVVSDEVVVEFSGVVEVDVVANDKPGIGTIDPTSLVISQLPSAGTASVNSSTGIVTYVHAGGTSLVDSFSYTVADDAGRVSSEAKVIVGVDDDVPPTAVNDSVEVFVASSSALNVLKNDLDDNEIDAATIDIVSQPQNGSIAIDKATGELVYTHDGFSTSDTFTYHVFDFANQVSNTALVEISIKTADTLIKSNLVLHLEADEGVTVNGSSVIEWSDQSSSENNLQSVGSPKLIDDSLNGLPVISFDGVSAKLERSQNIANLPAANNDRSVFILGRYKGDGFGGFAYGRPSGNNAFGAIVDSFGRLAAQGWGEGNDFLSKVPGKNQGWLVQSIVVESDVVSQYLNGDLIASEAHTFDTVNSRIVIGAGLSGEPFVDMEVAAVLVYDTALSITQQLQVHSYFNSKYKLETSNELAPIAENDRIILQAGNSAEVAILANDVDDFGLDVSTVTVTEAPDNGSVEVNPSTGTVTYKHNGLVSGDRFAYTVRDSAGQLSNEAIVTVSNLPSGIVAHFESDHGVHVNGEFVSGWNDLSAQGLDLTARGNVQLSQNVINGHPALTFDGIDDLLIREEPTGLPLGSSNRSVYFVANYQSIGSGGFGYGQAVNNKGFGLQTPNTGLLSVVGYGSGNDFVSSYSGIAAGWIVQSAVLENKALLHAVNGKAIDNFVHTYATGIGPMVLGAELGLDTTVQMQIAALIVFDRALTAKEQTEVQAYLRDKYQIIASDNPRKAKEIGLFDTD